jgi:hypothetical protein
VEPPTPPTFIDNGDGNASFDWQPTAADVGGYKLVTVVWDYSFEVDSSVTDLEVLLGQADLAGSEPQLEVTPNPLKGHSVITLSIPISTEVSLDVIGPEGRMTQVLPSTFYNSGVHEIAWDASALPAGLYFVRVMAGSDLLLRKVVILR